VTILFIEHAPFSYITKNSASHFLNFPVVNDIDLPQAIRIVLENFSSSSNPSVGSAYLSGPNDCEKSAAYLTDKHH
jgi:hypothetical protein